MGEKPKQTFLQRRHTDGQQIHEKMLNIAYNFILTSTYLPFVSQMF